MKINAEIIKKLEPCEQRFDNFLINYPDFDSNLEDFIKLENILYYDKVWVFTRLATHEQVIKWGLLCALELLPEFEQKYPEDKRPRQALDAVKLYLKDPSPSNIDNTKVCAVEAFKSVIAIDIHNPKDLAKSIAFSAADVANSTISRNVAIINTSSVAIVDSSKEDVNLSLMLQAIV